jgi:ketosteroid isomerase-like protein
MGGFEEAIDRYNEALQEFVKGDPASVRAMFSEREDVILCNPIQPFAKGISNVEAALEQASSLFSNGSCEIERIGASSSSEMAYVVQLERWEAEVNGEARSGALRVTMVFRNEDGDWKVSHRHAVPLERLGSI